jgi:hypothetical protein
MVVNNMAYPEPPKTKNITITKLRPELYNLYLALCEIESISREELFEAMLYDFTKKWMDVTERERGLEIDTEIMESLHHAVEEAFLNTVAFHSARYMPFERVPEDKRESVRAKMVRGKNF